MEAIVAKSVLTTEGWQQDITIAVGDAGTIESIDCGSGLDHSTVVHVDTLLPSPGNLHSHAFQKAIAGLTERRSPKGQDSFWTWRTQMYQFLERLTPANIESIAAQVQMEMLEAGFAAVGEFHYVHHQSGGEMYENVAELSERICAAARQTGIGLTLLPVLYQVGGCDGRKLVEGQLRFGCNLLQFEKLHRAAAERLRTLPADCRLGVAPHSLRAITKEGLQACLELAANAPIHIHLAEQTAEVDEVQAAFGKRPVEWLFDQFDVDQQWCLIHCTQAAPHEIMMIAESGAVVGLCPITESNLGDGIFDGARFANAGGSYGVGSDSNVRISLAEELRTLEYSQRLRDRARTVLATEGQSNGRTLLEKVCFGSAQALGRNAGAIQVGRIADLVALDGQRLDLAGRQEDNLLDSWMFASDDRVISDVWSAGRHVVQDGCHVERESITARFRETILQLSTR